MNGPRGQEITRGLEAAYAGLATTLEGLTLSQWREPTRCTGWEVRDVAGHVTGLAADVASGSFGTRTADEQAASLRDLPPPEMADRLRGAARTLVKFLGRLDDPSWHQPSGVGDLTIEEAILRLWHDLYIHNDDVLSALGLPSDQGPGLIASIDHAVAQLHRDGFGPARILLHGATGSQELRFGDSDAATAAIRVDAMRFLLVATGRADPAHLGLPDDVNIYRG